VRWFCCWLTKKPGARGPLPGAGRGRKEAAQRAEQLRAHRPAHATEHAQRAPLGLKRSARYHAPHRAVRFSGHFPDEDACPLIRRSSELRRESPGTKQVTTHSRRTQSANSAILCTRIALFLARAEAIRIFVYATPRVHSHPFGARGVPINVKNCVRAFRGS
jgi:hypothetical protein